ncbi:MAG: hypothetical protein IJF47_00820, partial [Candidatus Methanomethylophilaceae archaeon]|nr:hypothetical protein [Candidatus Methanomethylophilaceae archaeon]
VVILYFALKYSLWKQAPSKENLFVNRKRYDNPQDTLLLTLLGSCLLYKCANGSDVSLETVKGLYSTAIFACTDNQIAKIIWISY